MAIDSQTTGDLTDVPASDFQTLPKASGQLSPEVKFAPTCMMWCIWIGLGVIAGLVLLWAIPMLLSMFSGS